MEFIDRLLFTIHHITEALKDIKRFFEKISTYSIDTTARFVENLLSFHCILNFAFIKEWYLEEDFALK